LIRGNALLVLNLLLDVIDGVRGLHFERNSFASEGLHEDLHASSQSQHQVESRLLLDVVVRKGAAVLQLLACEDQSLLIRGNAFLVLNLLLDVIDRVRGLNFERNSFASEGLHEDLHCDFVFL
jgi:hypothetical protein